MEETSKTSGRQQQGQLCTMGASGNCQHIVQGPDGSWIIPLGTHFYFGTTVTTDGYTDSQDMKQSRDELVEKLQSIIDDNIQAVTSYSDAAGDKITDFDVRLVNTHHIMEALVVYIANRDGKVFDHAFKLGRGAK